MEFNVLQRVALRTHNPKVIGSSPIPATKTIKRLYYYSVAVFTFYFISTKDYPQDKNQFYHSLI